jgi:hypothetical protein
MKMISSFHGIMRIGFNVTGIYLHLHEYKAALLDLFSEMCFVNVAESIPRVEISDLPWKVCPNLIWKEAERRDLNYFVRIIAIKSLFFSRPSPIRKSDFTCSSSIVDVPVLLRLLC